MSDYLIDVRTGKNLIYLDNSLLPLLYMYVYTTESIGQAIPVPRLVVHAVPWCLPVGLACALVLCYQLIN